MDVALTPPGQLFCQDFRTGSEAHTRDTIKLLQVSGSHCLSRIPGSATPTRRPPPAAGRTPSQTGGCFLCLHLQWNIERGYQLAGIIEELRSIDADVISLQEVDVGCERSGGLDTGAPKCNSRRRLLTLPSPPHHASPSKPPSHAGAAAGVAIAEALHLNYVFLSEFEELHSPLRDARTQGGGVHGNAILTKFDILEAAVVPHR